MSDTKQEFIPLKNKDKHKNYVLIDKRHMNRFFMTLTDTFEGKKFTFIFKENKDELVISRLTNGSIGFSKKSKELELVLMLNREKETTMFVKDLVYGLEQKMKIRTTKLVDELPSRLVYSYVLLGNKNEVVDEFSMEVREEN